MNDEFLDKSAECAKEVILYTPSGAVALHSITTFLPTEVTHVTMIICCPLIVVCAKHVKHRRQRKRVKRGRHTREVASATE